MNILKRVGNFFLKSKLRLIIFLIVVLFAFGLLLATPDRDSVQKTTTPSPAPTKALTQQEQASLIQSKQRFISQLPIDNDQYLIEYFSDRDYFFVQIRKNPYRQYKQQIENIFRQNRIDPNYVNIEWGSVRGVGP